MFRSAKISPAIKYCSHEPETKNPGTIKKATYNATAFPKILMINLSISSVFNDIILSRKIQPVKLSIIAYGETVSFGANG